VTLGRRVPVGVPGVEQAGGLGAAPVLREQASRQARIEEREAPPLVHQADLGLERGLAGDRVEPGELLDEVLVPVLQRTQVPRPGDQLILTADLAVAGHERHRRAVHPGHGQDAPGLGLLARVRADPHAGRRGTEARPVELAADPVAEVPLRFRHRHQQHQPPAIPLHLLPAEGVDALRALAEQALAGRGERPPDLPADALGGQPVLGRGARQRLPGGLVLDAEQRERRHQRLGPDRAAAGQDELAQDGHQQGPRAGAADLTPPADRRPRRPFRHQCLSPGQCRRGTARSYGTWSRCTGRAA
jgi:hypothetical protein